MGDHRVSFKIEIEFHGVKDKYDAYLNWFDDEVEGVDQRIVDFVRDVYRRGMDAYNNDVYESQREQRERETEDKERKELARLKDKYEQNTV